MSNIYVIVETDHRSRYNNGVLLCIFICRGVYNSREESREAGSTSFYWKSKHERSARRWIL